MHFNLSEIQRTKEYRQKLVLISFLIVICTGAVELIKKFYIWFDKAGIIPIIISSTILLAFICIATFIFIYRHRLRDSEVAQLVWSCLIGLLTTYIGFSISIYTSELIKKQEDKEDIAAVLDFYVAKYEQESVAINNVTGLFHLLVPPFVGVMEKSQDSSDMIEKFLDSSENKEEQNSSATKDNYSGKKIINIQESFLGFMAQNIDLYSKLSPELQECVKNWEPINEKYDVNLLNAGYPMKEENPDLSQELLEDKRLEYLKTMKEVNNEMQKRSAILNMEQKYLKGEISEIFHNNNITAILVLYTELNSDLREINTMKNYEEYMEKFDDEVKRKIDNISNDMEKGTVFYMY